MATDELVKRKGGGQPDGGDRRRLHHLHARRREIDSNRLVGRIFDDSAWAASGLERAIPWDDRKRMRDGVARKAMALFWLHGFHGTSTQALIDHIKINRYSLFAEFGTKQGLFEAALALYESEIVQ